MNIICPCLVLQQLSILLIWATDSRIPTECWPVWHGLVISCHWCITFNSSLYVAILAILMALILICYTQYTRNWETKWHLWTDNCILWKAQWCKTVKSDSIKQYKVELGVARAMLSRVSMPSNNQGNSHLTYCSFISNNWIIAPWYSYQASGNDYQLQNQQFKELEMCPKSWIALSYTGEDENERESHEDMLSIW